MTLYSERLAYTASAGWSAYYVPAGYRAVVKTFAAVNFSGAVQHFAVAIQAVTVWASDVPASTTSMHVGVQLVLYAGEALWVQLAGAGTSLSVHGYVLSASGQQPRPLQELEVGALPAGVGDPR